MKTVAILGADFTPSSLPPALRIRFFAQHMAEFGWQPIIVTTDPKFYECPIDPENERLLPESIEVIRTPALPASLTRKIGIGDIGMRSMWHHWRALVDLCRKREIDLLFIPVPPSVPMVLGRLIHHRFGIPYVIDYIDPWISEYYWKLPRSQRPPKWAMAYALSRLLEPLSLKRVSHIVGVSRGVLDKVIARYPELTEADTTEIPYGCESADFEHVLKYPQKNRIFDPDDGLIHISYVGACTVGMQTTVKALFDGVRLGLTRSPEIFNRLRLHFVGTSYSRTGERKYQVLNLAQEAGIERLVDEHPDRVSYLEALQLLVDSKGLVILGYDEPHYAASKVYPYILAGKPLIAILHEASSPVEILRRAPAAHIITFGPQHPLGTEVEQISQKLETILSSPDEPRPVVSSELVESFTTRSMTARLCRCFDNVLLENQTATLVQQSAAHQKS